MRYFLGLPLGGRAEYQFPIPTLFDSRYFNKRALSVLLLKTWQSRMSLYPIIILLTSIRTRERALLYEPYLEVH